MSTELSYTKGNSLQRIVFDSATRVLSFEAELTDSPQEKAAVATDGWVNKPDGVTIKARLTDYPLGGLVEPGRAARILNELVEVKAAGLVCGLVCPLRTYDSLRISSIQVPQEKPKAGALEFSIVLRQAVIANSETVPQVTKLERNPQPLTDKGKKATGDGSGKANKSYLIQGYEGISNGVKQLIPEGWKR